MNRSPDDYPTGSLFVIRTIADDAAILTVNDTYVRYMDPRDEQTDELIVDIARAVDRWSTGTDIVRYDERDVVDQLNRYTGEDVWTDVITDLPVYHEGRTDALPDLLGEHAFVLIDGVIAGRHPETNQWAVYRPGSLTLADLVATIAHAGQVDKAGVPYIEHPRAVAKKVDTYPGPYVIVALLHDTVEDTYLTLEDLATLGFSGLVQDAVAAVTRAENETYMDFIGRAAAHRIGRVVKLADNEHNTERLGNLDPRTAERMRRRYARAREILEAAQ